MNNQIIIQVYNTMGASIAKLKDYLQLSIQIPPLYKDKMILNCYEEREGGIYVFNIEDFINPFARVFVILKQNVLLEEKMLSHNKNINLTYTSYILKEPYCLHPECSQINFVETMINTSKPTPFTFNTTQNKVNIGIIKAYKKDIDSTTFLQDIALKNPHNEIYTLDIKQRIRLQAFIYERQKTYVREVSDIYTQTRRNHFLEQGNITKTILTPPLKESSKIKWAFKVVSQSYHGKNATTGRLKKGSKNQGEPFVPAHLQFLSSSGIHTKYVYKKEDIVNIHQILDNEYYVLLNEEGSCIDISLEDLFTGTILTSLVDKNIIFFAFIDTPQYHFYSKKNDIVLQDRISSIELKILKTRFSFEFDGGTLSLLENQRILERWEARSEMALKNFFQDSKENQQRQRFSLPYKDHTSFYYDLNLHTQNTKPIDEGHYMVKFNSQNLNAFLSIYDNNDKEISHIKPFKEENLNALDIKIFDTNESFFTSLLQILMQDKNNNDVIQIPLKIKYQKRILMLIQRFHQSTESTKAKINIFIDGQRVDEKGKLTNESFYSSLNQTNPYAYILERPGPDSIAGELKLRIPEGRYDVILQQDSKFGESLNIHNEFVHPHRNILIHNGHSPKHSDGCLLINHNEIFKNNIPLDNILHIAKKDKLIKDMKKLFKSLNVKSNSFEEFVKEYMEVRVENGFRVEEYLEIAWGKHKNVSKAFREKVILICKNLEIEPDYLMSCIALETVKTFSPSVTNPLTTATGLIQFLESTAKKLGTTTEKLSKMTQIEQLDYVEKYFLPYRGKIKTIEDIYMVIFYPKAVGKPNNYIISTKGSNVYEKNKSLDVDKNGILTKGEAGAIAKQYLKEGLEKYKG